MAARARSQWLSEHPPRLRSVHSAMTSNKRHGRRSSKFWKTILRQYCENTTLHGFRYIVSRDSTILEKCSWSLVCILGLTFSVLLILLIWQKFRQTPTVTTIDSTTHPIFSLNFPAVSICNYNKVYKPHAEEFAEIMRTSGFNETEIQNFFAALPKLIRTDYVDNSNTRALEFMTKVRGTIEDMMYKMMQPCKNLLLRCAWEGKIYECEKIFKPIKSIEGFCCAFNYQVDTSENSLFGIKTSKKEIPDILTSSEKLNLTKERPGVYEVLSVPGAGRDVGLSVVLDLEGDKYFGSIRPSVGATVLVHDPFIYPEVEVLSSFIQTGQEIAVILSGTITSSDPDVRHFDLNRRACWFSDEIQLNISLVYSYQACITECRIKYINRYCKCVPFYYPNYNNQKLCDLEDINCLTKHRGNLSNLRTTNDLATENENDTVDSLKCDCLPTCNDHFYTSNSENAFMESVPYHTPILHGFNVKNVSLASIYFRGITCLKYRKESWKTWDDAVASFGGIFGLCLGGSLISLVEFFCYFAMRVYRGSMDDGQEDRGQDAEAAAAGRRQAGDPRVDGTPRARQLFRVVSIDRLHDWTRKPEAEPPRYKLAAQQNYWYLHEMSAERKTSPSTNAGSNC